LVVVRDNDDGLWKMTCDEVACTPFTMFPGRFHYQPTVTWDEAAQEWVVAGTALDNTIWMATFDKQGNFNNDWQSLPGRTPSPAGLAGGTPKGVTRTVTCPGQSLQTAVNAAQEGDIINVTGTCNENVTIERDKHSLTLDGGGVATLNGPDSAKNTLLVRGKGMLIQNFTITGGSTGVQIWRSSAATINNNNIHNTGGWGIGVVGSSYSVIKNNNIHDNPSDGILVSETSSAHIGFDNTSETSASPNTIQSNGGRGIRLLNSAFAWIVGNTITNNTSDGIGVFRLSQANTAGNIINANGGSGINLYGNSGVELGEDNPPTFLQQPNTTSSNNTRYGIECNLGGYVRGHLGSSNQINGTLGQTGISTTCPNSLVTP